MAMRVFMVWLYNNTGKSVFAAALFHASSNFERHADGHDLCAA